jgi:hypothetical protein
MSCPNYFGEDLNPFLYTYVLDFTGRDIHHLDCLTPN